MKFKKNSTYEKIGRKVPFLRSWAYVKQTQKRDSLSGSILDKRTNMLVPLGMLLPAIIIILLFTIVPMFLNIVQSFEDNKTGNVTLANYQTVFTSSYFALGVRNSFIYGFLVLPSVMFLSLVISSLIAKTVKKLARGFWQTIFFLPYVTNGTAVALTFIQVFSKNGLFNNIVGSEIPWLETANPEGFYAFVAIFFNGIWNGLAFNILIFTTAMLSVDKNLYKAASIDGTNGIQQFFKVTLPSIKGTINYLITLSIIGSIKVFPLALYQNKPLDALSNGASTIMLYVYYTVKIGDFGLSGAASILLFIIGFTFSTIVRGGFFMIQLTLNNLGERNVWVKVKNTKLLN